MNFASSILAAGGIPAGEVTKLFLALGILLLAARLCGEIARHFGQPMILGEILAGVILGPTLLGAMFPQWQVYLFAREGAGAVALEGFVVISASMMLMVAGLEVDLSTVWRQGKRTVVVSLASMVVPFLMGFGLAWVGPGLLGLDDPAMKLPFALFIGVALSITALPVIARVLMDLNLSKSDLGVLIMSAAMINDLLGWIGFALILALMSGSDPNAAAVSDASSIGMTVLLTFVFLIFMLTAGRWLIHKTLPVIQAHGSWPGGVLGFVMVVALLCAAITEHLGIHSIFGAFIAGVALGDSKHLREKTRETILNFVMYIFAPVFFASIGLHVNFISSFDLMLVVVVMVIAILGKLVGCYLGAILVGISRRDGLAFSFGMVARGAMEVILGQLALEAGLIGEKLFVAIIVMAVVTSLIAGPAMQKVLHRRQRRRLVDVISEKQFVSDLSARSAKQVIEEMAQVAARHCGLEASLIAKRVWQREQIIHTGLGDALAVPHGRFDELGKPLVILGRSRSGVDFDAPDGEPARIICMLLVPASGTGAQLELLDMVARTFHDPAVRAGVLEAQNYTQARAVMNVGGEQGEHGQA